MLLFRLHLCAAASTAFWYAPATHAAGKCHMSLRRVFHRRRELPFAEYGCDVRDFDLPRDGRVQYAQWLHPYDRAKAMTQATVDGVRRFVSPGDFVIDIGAYTGDTSVPMALAAGATGCTLALEPNSHVFRILEQNARLNREKTNIVPRCLAATEADGTFVFHYCDASFCNGGFRSQQRWRLYRRKYPLAVEGRNLLNLLRAEFAEWLHKLSYVKVDAEGYDRAILASIMPILRETRPVIRTEVFRKLLAGERFALFDLLVGAGYQVHRFEEAAEPVGRSLERRDMTGEKHFDLLALPPRMVDRDAIVA
jgi:FkbM family methyltransferase